MLPSAVGALESSTLLAEVAPRPLPMSLCWPWKMQRCPSMISSGKKRRNIFCQSIGYFSFLFHSIFKDGHKKACNTRAQTHSSSPLTCLCLKLPTPPDAPCNRSGPLQGLVGWSVERPEITPSNELMDAWP